MGSTQMAVHSRDTSEGKLDYIKLAKVYKLLCLLRNREVYSIVKFLEENGPSKPSIIQRKLKITEFCVVNTKLSKLKKAGLVTIEKAGVFSFYKLDVERIKYIRERIKIIL